MSVLLAGKQKDREKAASAGGGRRDLNNYHSFPGDAPAARRPDGVEKTGPPSVH